jgi:hypothetical protein
MSLRPSGLLLAIVVAPPIYPNGVRLGNIRPMWLLDLYGRSFGQSLDLASANRVGLLPFHHAGSYAFGMSIVDERSGRTLPVCRVRMKICDVWSSPEKTMCWASRDQVGSWIQRDADR